MRMFSLKDLFTTLCSVLCALAVMATSVSADDKASSQADAASSQSTTTKTAKKSNVDERDFYTRRAQELLDADHAADAKSHPLTENYPEHFVVVCTGGCKNHQAHIVDFEPRKSTKESEVGEMIPTAAGASDGLGVNVISCIAGCRDGNSVYLAAGEMDADWDSTRAPAKSPAKSGTTTESGRWLSDQN